MRKGPAMVYGFSTSPYVKQTDVVSKRDTSSAFVKLYNLSALVFTASDYRPKDGYHDQRHDYGLDSVRVEA